MTPRAACGLRRRAAKRGKPLPFTLDAASAEVAAFGDPEAAPDLADGIAEARRRLAEIVEAGELPAEPPVGAVGEEAFRMERIGQYLPDGTASTVKARDAKDYTDLVVRQPGPEVAFSHTWDGRDARAGETPTLRAGSAKPKGAGHLAVADALHFEPRVARNGRGAPSETVSALTRAGSTGKGDQAPHVVAETPAAETVEVAPGAFWRRRFVLRRLTPTECERLQGFPDGWTDVAGADGKPAADGPRYHAMGNSMAVPVMAALGGALADALSDRDRIAGLATTR